MPKKLQISINYRLIFCVMKERQGFATRIGAIAATVGSAVGLGNIWRFPYEAGQNGGGAFILVYVICVVVLGIPVILSEFIIGRSTHKNMKGALRQLSPGKKYYWFTPVCIIGSVVTLSFYSVVCGWVMDYLFMSATGALSGHSPEGYSQIFTDFVSNPWRCVGWTLLFLIINFLVMRKGIRGGVERAANVMMPLLFLLLLIFCIHALLLPGSEKGLRFLFYPDFSQLTGRGVVDAMGQAFMSLTLGISGLVTYSSYFSDKTSLTKDAVCVAILDTMVAILSGVMIFPAVFSYGMEPEAGPKLIFEILPGIFNHMTGGVVWAVMFFLLVFFASLTSTISLNEISVTYLVEEKKVSRERATWMSAGSIVTLAILSALSFNVLSGLTLWGMNIFDLLNYMASNVFMLLGGLFTALYVGWVLDRKVIADQLTNHGALRGREIPYVVFCLRWVAPVAVLLIFLWCVGLL